VFPGSPIHSKRSRRDYEDALPSSPRKRRQAIAFNQISSRAVRKCLSEEEIKSKASAQTSSVSVLSEMLETQVLSSRTGQILSPLRLQERQHALRTLLQRVPTGTLSRQALGGESQQRLRVHDSPESPWMLTERVGGGKYGETFRAHSNGQSAICKVSLSPDEAVDENFGKEEQVLEALVHLLVNETDPRAAPRLFGLVHLQSTATPLRKQRKDDLAILMQPLHDTLGERVQLASPAAARRAARAAVRDIARVFSNLAWLGFSHGDLHPDNVMYCKSTGLWRMIDFGRAAVRPPHIPGAIAVDPEMPESSPGRDLASLIGNLELLWEFQCEQTQPLFPKFKELLRQKLGLPEVDSSEYWMAERSQNEYLDVAFSPGAVLTELVGPDWSEKSGRRPAGLR